MTRQVPSIGRKVHFVLDRGKNKGQHRSADIVNVVGDEIGPESAVNLMVMTDADDDGLSKLVWVKGVKYDGSESPGLRTWHWPEFVPPVE